MGGLARREDDVRKSTTTAHAEAAHEITTQWRQLLHASTIRHALYPATLVFESPCALTLCCRSGRTIVGFVIPGGTPLLCCRCCRCGRCLTSRLPLYSTWR